MGSPSDFFSRLNVAGGSTFNGNETEKRLLTANLQMDAERDSEIAFELYDPNHQYFRSFGDQGPLGKSAQYENLKLQVAAFELGPGASGHGNTVLRLRPEGLQRSRAIKGALTRQNISPTQFVIDGAASAGMACVAQESPVRPSISRDVVDEGAEASDTEDKNEWTTLIRLAAEEGFLIFESMNVLYFGSPKWLFDTRPNHVVGWRTEGSALPANSRMVSSPSANTSSTSSQSDDFTFTLPLMDQWRILPGHTVDLRGVPFTSKRLLVTSVEYPLAGDGLISITAKRPWVIEKQDTPEQAAAKKAAQQAAKGSGGGAGTNFGPSGAGAAHYVKEICAAAKERNLGKDGARNGVATALVETNLKMYANNAVPESLKYPHDAVGSDHDSVGLFQQRQAGWGTLAERMNPRASAGLFFNKMMTFNWRGMDPGAACQKVQVSAFPAKYGQRMAEAQSLVDQHYG